MGEIQKLMETRSINSNDPMKESAKRKYGKLFISYNIIVSCARFKLIQKKLQKKKNNQPPCGYRNYLTTALASTQTTCDTLHFPTTPCWPPCYSWDWRRSAQNHRWRWPCRLAVGSQLNVSLIEHIHVTTWDFLSWDILGSWGSRNCDLKS